MGNNKINISDKELDRDIINLNLPEIDWTKTPTGYSDDFDKKLEQHRKSKKNNGAGK